MPVGCSGSNSRELYQKPKTSYHLSIVQGLGLLLALPGAPLGNVAFPGSFQGLVLKTLQMVVLLLLAAAVAAGVLLAYPSHLERSIAGTASSGAQPKHAEQSGAFVTQPTTFPHCRSSWVVPNPLRFSQR